MSEIHDTLQSSDNSASRRMVRKKLRKHTPFIAISMGYVGPVNPKRPGINRPLYRSRRAYFVVRKPNSKPRGLLFLVDAIHTFSRDEKMHPVFKKSSLTVTFKTYQGRASIIAPHDGAASRQCRFPGSNSASGSAASSTSGGGPESSFVAHNATGTMYTPTMRRNGGFTDKIYLCSLFSSMGFCQ
ncbi:hypothetical protein CPB85DRAFT_952664 [Mucidula mucida]|nr:hypothetical protein CPB85DRAFT_952664 [Mucidula mucida]